MLVAVCQGMSRATALSSAASGQLGHRPQLRVLPAALANPGRLLGYRAAAAPKESQAVRGRLLPQPIVTFRVPPSRWIFRGAVLTLILGDKCHLQPLPKGLFGSCLGTELPDFQGDLRAFAHRCGEGKGSGSARPELRHPCCVTSEKSHHLSDLRLPLGGKWGAITLQGCWEDAREHLHMPHEVLGTQALLPTGPPTLFRALLVVGCCFRPLFCPRCLSHQTDLHCSPSTTLQPHAIGQTP